jgi:uncharacterized membrane protein
VSTSDEGRREPTAQPWTRPAPTATPTTLPEPIPGPAALDADYYDRRTPEQMAADERATRQRAHQAAGEVGQVDQWDEPEPARRDLYDRTAWIERMFWRNGFLIMFVIGVIAFAFGLLDWPYAAALAVGGLAPGLFLMAREQAERNVEADRMAMRPETRHAGDLPPLRRTVHRPLELDE